MSVAARGVLGCLRKLSRSSLSQYLSVGGCRGGCINYGEILCKEDFYLLSHLLTYSTICLYQCGLMDILFYVLGYGSLGVML